jgi:hypothetical protein
MQIILATYSMADEAVPAIFMCVCIWIPIFVCMAVSFWVSIRDGIAHLKKLHQIPCDRCVFFTGTYHLKCTINPCAAFTEEAIQCRDFEPRSNLQPTCSRKSKRWFVASAKPCNSDSVLTS